VCVCVCVCVFVCVLECKVRRQRFIQYFWQGNYQLYGHIRCTYTRSYTVMYTLKYTVIYSYTQERVIRSFETLNTVEYVFNTKYAYNTIVFSSSFESADLTQNGPDLPQITQNASNSIPIYYILL
jgi:hypothetical protein